MSALLIPPELERSDAVEEAQAILADARRVARRSNLVSAGALLVSAFAVVLSSGGGGGGAAGARLVGETPAGKALNPETHYVRLPELAIYQDQIVEGAVGTEELSDASVTAAKLAPGAVTGAGLAAGSVGYEALEGGTIARIAAEVTNSRTVVGEVHEDATVSARLTPPAGSGSDPALSRPGCHLTRPPHARGSAVARQRLHGRAAR